MDNLVQASEYDGMNMPFNLDAEQAVLGSVLIDSSCMEQVMIYLKPEYFYLPQHKSIFEVMVTMYTAGSRIDPVVVLENLKKDGVYDDAGGKTYLFQLAQMVPSTANVEAYAKIVREKYYMRALITASREIIDNAVSGQEDADLLLDSAEQRIYDIRQGKDTTGPSKLKEIVVNEVYDRLNKLNSDEREKYLGIPTGFSELDKLTTGLNKSDLILIGARPAMGKTSFALNLARNVGLLAKRKVVFFSLEMTKEQLAQRMLASEAGVSSTKLRSGILTRDEWMRLGTAAGVLNDCEIYFDDTSSITVPEMKARIRKMRNVDLVIIDYLGLMSTGRRSENRVQEISEITRGLKMMAKDLNIPVVACAQLSRNTEARGKSHRPQLSDLRDSGSIEQDADIVMMLYRDDYYSDDENDDNPEHNTTEVIVAKNRHGGVDTIKLHWEPEFTRFTTQERVHYDE